MAEAFNVGERVRARTTDGETIVGTIARNKRGLPCPYEVEVDWADSEGLTDDAIHWYHAHYAGPFKAEELERVE